MSIQVLDGEKVYLGSAEPSSGGGTVINNQDITITANGVYTAGEGYTGIGTATVNVVPQLTTLNATENGTYTPQSPNVGYSSVVVNTVEADIVTAKNMTGSAIAQNDRVWLEKVSGGWNIVPSIKNFAVTGTLTESNKTFSGFTKSDYISLPLTFRPASSTWEMVFKFKPDSVGGINVIFGKTTSIYYGVFIMVQAGNLKYFAPKNSSSNFIDALGSHTVSADVWQWVKFVYTGTEYIGYYSTDGVNWEVDLQISDSRVIYDYAAASYIGRKDGTGVEYPFDGEIDLGRSYIKVGGSYTFVPFAKFDLPEYFDGIAGEAIANNASGDVKTALGEESTVI